MPKEINSDLLRGNINTIILSALYSGDRYGYEIVNEIEKKSRRQAVGKIRQALDEQRIQNHSPLFDCKIFLTMWY